VHLVGFTIEIYVEVLFCVLGSGSSSEHFTPRPTCTAVRPHLERNPLHIYIINQSAVYVPRENCRR
jgi:hypothetical protein